MCGINGIFAYHYAANPIDREELIRTRDHVTAREPDAAGVFLSEDGRLGLGHRRPSMNDLSEVGAQPMLSSDGRLAVICNGEIYNYQELRRRLEDNGSIFNSHSNAEVLLHLYAEKGADMARDLRGTFAFAIGEADRRRLFLARSADGGKPLYYTDDGWTLRFATRKEALAADSTAVPEVLDIPAGQAILTDALGPQEPIPFSFVPPAPSVTARRGVRILALITDGFGGHGGIAQYNRDFLTALAAADGICEVAVLPRCAEAHPRETPQRIRQYPAVYSRARYTVAAARLALTSGPLDLVFCGHLFMAPVGAAIAKLLRIPMWLQLHGVDAWDKPGALVRWAAAQSDLVTAVSRYTRQRFLQWASLPPSRVRILPNTFEARFSPGPKPQRLLEHHGLQGKKVLLTVSRLWASEQYKGQDRVIRVLPRLVREGNDAVYIIVGDGDDLPRLQADANNTGMSRRVIFTGRVSEADLPDYYRAADVFVMPSTGEGFGIAFLEAASANVPVIGGNRDGSVDALADGAIGLAVDPHDPRALAAAISQCLKGGHPQATGLDRFSRKNFAFHTAALLSSVMKGVFASPGEQISTNSSAYRTP